jgi:hypothetical protein
VDDEGQRPQFSEVTVKGCGSIRNAPTLGSQLPQHGCSLCLKSGAILFFEIKLHNEKPTRPGV